ncbi:TadA family conjugal transfer-associated ATPase [Microlunatus capsulatus]|uniref:Pilus assembly protein CpaF n=1 Tax=Microlunatus capsulatus TaxID=99117 RepID=A0ABS4Z976_9ACTN|nr:TadA family conjugal transfer-associated ATPase [Microlunatus capsulatus]MBP2417595.1 pilus assembly protein CpaF [Microlunatus capsulatus]
MSAPVELDPLRTRLVALGRPHTAHDVAEAMRAEGRLVTDAVLVETVEALRRHSVGAGPLEPLLRLPGVTDVLVNGPEQVLLDRGAGLEAADVRFGSDAEVRALAQRLAASVGRRLDDASPFVDARLPDGTRLHAVLATVARPGTCLSLRVPARRGLGLDDFVASGAMGPRAAALLRRLVEARLAFLVSGGTGSGKTTLLSALLALVPPGHRIVVAEDSRELDPAHPHVVRLEGRPANAEGAGALGLTELVRQALRMRPDRLVVGEVRGAEICDLLRALNTGHEGGCGTVHANSAEDVPARLEALGALGGLGRAALHAQIASALDVVLHIRRDEAGVRRLAEVHVVVRDERSGLTSTSPAVTFGPGGRSRLGPGSARLERLLDR